jgi:molybdenum cofactor biosynthesis enzyme MoaA
MENRVPTFLSGQRLSVEDYCRNLDHIARNGIAGISFTGGEPTLNPDLVALVRHAATAFERVELTSNGLNLREMLPDLAKHLHLLKVSLDTTDPLLVRKLTRGSAKEFSRASNGVKQACQLGLTVGVNAVVMRSTIDGIDGLIEFCRNINANGYPGRVYLSLLDFYYSSEQRQTWEREFVPIESVARQFDARYGPRVAQERFGCTFYWFDADGVIVRFKDSLGATQRAAKCQGCKHYCQEGIYGIKHSVEGWVTSCPNGEPALGAHLAQGITDDEADALLRPLMEDIRAAAPDRASFSTMLSTHLLRPEFATAVLSEVSWD